MIAGTDCLNNHFIGIYADDMKEPVGFYQLAVNQQHRAALLTAGIGVPAYLGKDVLHATAQTSRLVAACAAEALITPDALHIDPEIAGRRTRVLTYEQIFSTPACGPLDPLGSDEPAYAQFSSGSTSSPKGLRITQRGLSENVTAILRHGLRIREDDRDIASRPNDSHGSPKRQYGQPARMASALSSVRAPPRDRRSTSPA